MRKAQAAMEFLMTYGWAILVVLVAIGALAYFGVLNPEKILPEKCILSTGSGLFCEDHTASSTDDTITLRIHNILSDSVTVSSVSIADPACSSSGSVVIAADEKSDVVLDCSDLIPSQKIKGDITVAFQKGSDGLDKSTTGSIVTVVP